MKELNLKSKIIDENSYANNKEIKVLGIVDVIEVKNASFSNCENLETIYFGADISKIGSKAFSNCSNLKDAYFPLLDNHEIEIEEDSFEGCKNVVFHLFGYMKNKTRNASLETFAKKHNIKIESMI